MGKNKIEAISKDRWRATASEKRLYGGSTVTEFYVYHAHERDDAKAWKVVTGYGKTSGERKTNAIERFEAQERADQERKDVTT